MQKMCTFKFKGSVTTMFAGFLLLFAVYNANAQCNVTNTGALTAPTCSPQTFNFGSGESRSITLSTSVKYDFTWSNPNGCGDANNACVNGTAGNQTGWTPPATSIAVGTNRSSTWASCSSVLTYRISAPTTASVSPASTSICGLTSGSLGGNSPSIGTGTWTQASGPGTSTFSAANSPTSTVTVSAYGSYTYTWTINNGGCTSSATTASITFYQSPSLTVPATVCDNTTASVSSNISVTWTASAGSFTGTNPSAGVTFNPPNVTAPTANQNVTITGTNGACASSSVIRVDNRPALTVPASVCDNATMAVSSDVSGTWTATTGSFTGTNPGTSLTYNPAGITPPTASQGVTITVTNGVCAPTAATTVYNLPTLTVPATVCDNSTAAVSSDVSVTWTAGSGSFTGTNPGTSVTFNPPAVAAPTVNQNVTITGTNGACAPSSVIRVDNRPALTVPASVCDNATMAVSSDVSGTWTATTGSFTGTNPGTSLTYNPAGITPPTASQGVTITVTNGVCAPTAATTVYNLPTLTVPATVCDNSTAAVSSDVSVTWTAGSGSFTGTNPGTSVTFNPANLTPPTVNQNVTITGTNGACAPTAIIRVDNLPTLTVPAAVCDNATAAMSSDVSLTWSAGSGTFSGTNPGTSVTFNPPAVAAPTVNQNVTITGTNGACAPTAIIRVDNNPTLTVPTAVCDNSTAAVSADVSATWTAGSGSYTGTNPGTSLTFNPPAVAAPTQNQNVVLTATNGTCAPTATIRVDNAPTAANAGSDIPQCASSTFTLAGNAPGVTGTTQLWTCFSGCTGLTITTPGSATSTVTSVPNGTTTLTWTFTNGVCSSSDNVDLTNSAQAVISGSTAVCDDQTGGVTYNNNVGSTNWSVTPGSLGSINSSGLFIPANIATPTQSASGSIVVTNGACVTNYNITVYNKPSITSSNASMCQGDVRTLTADVNGTTFTGTGVNFNGTNYIFTAPNPGGTSANYIITASSGSGCQDQQVITVYQNASITSSAADMCEGQTRTLNASIGPGFWSATCGGCVSGNIFTAPVPSGNSATYTISYAVIGSACNAATQNITVYAQPVLTIPSAVCESSTASVSSTKNVTWSAASGSFSPGSGTSSSYSPANLTAPTASSTILITGTNGACSASGNITVWNNANITSSAAAMCEGSTRTLTADIGPGTWTGDCGACVSGTTFTAPTPVGNMSTNTMTYTVTGSACAAPKQDIDVYHLPSTANAGPNVTNGCGLGTTLQGVAPTYGSGTWTQFAGPGSTTFNTPSSATSTTTVSSLGTYTYTWTVGNGPCPTNSDNTDVTYNTAMSASYAFDDCMNAGGSDYYYVMVTGSAGTPPYTFSGTPVGNVSGTQKVYEQLAGSSTSYTVTDNIGCTATVTPTAPSGHPTDIPFTSTTGSKTVDCYDQALNKWLTFRDNNNDAILSIQAGSVDLGLVNVTVYRDGSETSVFPSVTQPNCQAFTDLKAMKRHFVMTSSNYAYPAVFPSNVGVRLYFSDAELQSLITASTGNNIPNNSCSENDDINSLSELYVTKYSGPNEDNDYSNNNVSGVYKVYGDANGYGTPDGPLTKSANGFSTLFTSGQNHHYVQMNVDRFSEFWMYGSKQAQALPVEMIYFEANAIDNSYIQLKWATALEINNHGFWIERSVDGVNFTQIAWVDGHNNTTIQQNYSYNDINVNNGVRYYYRLQQVDNDGQFEYTDVVSAIINNSASFEVMDFVPNPTSQATNLVITSGSEQEISVELYNIIGEKVLSEKHGLTKGTNQIAFDLNMLASGTYTAVVTSNNDVHSKKLVISK